MKIVISVFVLAGFLLQTGPTGPLDGQDLPPVDLDRISVGDLLPDFRLEGQNGQIHQLSDYFGEKKLVLVFFRGHW